MRKKKDPKTALAKQFDKESEWIKNPFLYAQIGGDMNLMQRELVLSVASSLQDRIKMYMDSKKAGGNMLSLFSDDDFEGSEIVFQIKTNDMLIRPDEYKELDEACMQLSKMNMTYETYDEQAKVMKKHYSAVFSDVTMPFVEVIDAKTGEKKRKRKGYVEVRMRNENVKALFNMSKGYVEHLRRIVSMSKLQRTPAFYIFFAGKMWSDKKDKKHQYPNIEVKFTDLKDFLGFYEKDGNGKIIEEKEPEFGKFKIRVMNPVLKEMKKLAEQNMIDFWVDTEYEPVYTGKAHRGNPESIIFTLHLTEMGKAHRLHVNTPKTSIVASDITDKTAIEKAELTLHDKACWQNVIGAICSKDASKVEYMQAFTLVRVGECVELEVPSKAFTEIPLYADAYKAVLRHCYKEWGYTPKVRYRG